MSASRIISFHPMPVQPIPQRSRVERFRTMPQFAVLVHWFCSAVLHHHGHPVEVLHGESIAPALRDLVEEETLRTLATLDPIAESTARHRARQAAMELLARTLANATEAELQDPDYLRDRGAEHADAVLKAYRNQLIYGAVNP